MGNFFIVVGGGGGGWVKMSTTMDGRQGKIWLKRPKAIPYIKKLRPKYQWFKITYLEFFFGEILFQVYNFSYSSTRSSGHYQSFFQSQSRSKNLTHFTSLNSLDIENNMLMQHSQKPFSLYKFFSKHISVLCQKKHLHCTVLDSQDLTS